MSDNDLRELCDKATELGDDAWAYHNEGPDNTEWWGIVRFWAGERDEWLNLGQMDRKEDAEFWIAARDAVPRLLDAVERVRALHAPIHFDNGFAVFHATCGTCDVPWPCPTISALDGDVSVSAGHDEPQG